MNIKIKEITIKKPGKPARPGDHNNRICIVTFDNNTEWCPTFAEVKALNDSIEAVKTWNYNKDTWGKRLRLMEALEDQIS